MIALGNDVIDLAESPKNGAAYYERLVSYALTQFEHKFLESDTFGRNTLLRLVWAVKESAYKSSNKLGNLERFAPSSCQLLSLDWDQYSFHGTVRLKGFQFVFAGIISDDFIHAVTQHEVTKCSLHQEKLKAFSYSDQSYAVRKLVLNRYNNSTIEKDENGIPWLLEGARRVELSLSHHGRFGAWAVSV